MTLADIVGVPLSPKQCAASAKWLRRYTPPQTLLGNPDDAQVSQVCADLLAAQFEKAGNRLSRDTASRNIDRPLAEWFASLLDAAAITGQMPPKDVVAAMRACHAATHKGKPGAKVKVRTVEQVKALALGNPFDDSEVPYRKKLLARAEYHEAVSAWLRGIAERGETLLTSLEPMPKISPKSVHRKNPT